MSYKQREENDADNHRPDDKRAMVAEISRPSPTAAEQHNDRRELKPCFPIAGSPELAHDVKENDHREKQRRIRK